ncbi:SNW domain-containing protein 1 [Trichinella spiralis]|uniref:SNW domain-containing protein 1 n=1 Tax=Trichinella spiralis TaxID=6334 RepID=UPI0001EFE590|nr:SNW domain-containing protein 1 [Trichinella spiralis]
MSVLLTDILPKPSRVVEDRAATDPWFKPHEKALGVASKKPPPYGARQHWRPTSDSVSLNNDFFIRHNAINMFYRVKDFGDGGAFPEIHIAQFPNGLGRSNKKQGNSNQLALQLDSSGKVRYDAIVRHGHSNDKIIYHKLSDLKGQLIDESDDSFHRPKEEDLKEVTEKTRAALEKITQTKIAAALPVRHAEKVAPSQYIRYTPSQQNAQLNSGAQQRIIRMVEVQQDPMEPPRFKINQKIPRPPPSPPAPVSVKEQQEWKIPPCISNWKNAKGFTVPLDKRLAADGRGLQQVHINENFAKLAEALYIADRKAREAVEMRAQLERKLAQKEKEDKEERMRQMAQKAREERAGMRKEKKRSEIDEDVKERDALRHDKQMERRRERNIARAAPDKQAKLRRDIDRDISEKIALGLPDARIRTNETQFDHRLFNQSKGLDAGGGLDDETYSAYDKPWRAAETTAQSIYRPSKNLDSEIYGTDLDRIISTNRFVPDKGFSGADDASKRSGPVQFERSEEDDPFGLGQLLRSVKEQKKRPADGSDSGSNKVREQATNKKVQKRKARSSEKTGSMLFVGGGTAGTWPPAVGGNPP